MSKNQEFKNEEATKQMLSVSYKFVHDSTRTFIKLYEYKYKMLQREIMKHEENKLLKIFNKTHKSHKSKREQLNLELEKTFNNLMEEYTNFGNLIEFS